MKRFHLGPAALCAAMWALAACSSGGGATGVDGGPTDDGSTGGGKLRLLINEVVTKAAPGAPANPTGSDWLELYNPGGVALDLGGFRLLDSAKKPFANAFSLPPGTAITARGYRVVYFNHDGAGSPVIDKGLGADEAATLWDRDGTLLDRVNWELGDAPEGASWGRVPDGDAVFKTMTEPTPGAANRGPGR